MKTNKKPPRRKPSVALSRKFTFSDQLMDQLRPPNSRLEPINESLKTKKVQPPSPENENSGNTVIDDISEEDIAYLKEDETLENIDNILDKFNIPWMTEILRNHDYFSKYTWAFPYEQKDKSGT